MNQEMVTKYVVRFKDTKDCSLSLVLETAESIHSALELGEWLNMVEDSYEPGSEFIDILRLAAWKSVGLIVCSISGRHTKAIVIAAIS